MWRVLYFFLIVEGTLLERGGKEFNIAKIVLLF